MRKTPRKTEKKIKKQKKSLKKRTLGKNFIQLGKVSSLRGKPD